MITVNGKQSPDALGITLKEYLENSGYNIARVAVEINGEIIPKANYTEYKIKENDKIEVVSFVGGG